jgi:acetyl/propionyl-CoA carboxylase alpha subunit
MNGPAVVGGAVRVAVQAPTAPAARADEGVQQHRRQVYRGRDGVKVRLGEQREHRIEVTSQQAGAWAGRIDGKPFLARIEVERDRCIVRRQCVRFDFVEDTGAEHHVSAEHEGHFRAPMPGHVLDVRVAAGQAVAAGAVLMVLEAMKMEHSLTAPWDARVTHVHVETGQRVEEGADLVQIEPVAATS